MYKIGNLFEVPREEMLAFMKAHELAFVTSAGKEFPVASQLPLSVREHDGAIYLEGHLMRKTDHHLAFEASPNVLAIFYSPHAWISAEWYAKQATGSTVNYMAVHAKGRMHFLSEEQTRDAVRDITDRHIGKTGPSAFDALGDEYINRLVKAIVGFSIEVVKVDAVFKLSQDRERPDALNIIAELDKRNRGGDRFIAAEMKKIHDAQEQAG